MTRLTEEMVIARSKQSDLGSIKKLNCWGSDLSDVSIVKRMRGVEVLALSVNKINTLQPFEDCTKLQELYLRKNNIQDINEIAYLQSLPSLKYLWLEENPCCDKAGSKYRSTVLRALPNLKKLDNIEVTQEEIDEALRDNGGRDSISHEQENYEDAYDVKQQQQQQQQQYETQQHHHQQRQQQQQQQHYQSPPQSQSQMSQQYYAQQRNSSSPQKETSHSQQTSSENTEESISEPLNEISKPSSPQEQTDPSSPRYNNNSNHTDRTPCHQFDRSPGSDQGSPHAGYRDRASIPSTISTHSMKEYYQSDRPAYPVNYRHSQSDLTEWDEHPQPHNHYGSISALHHGSRRTVERDDHRYSARNANVRENGDWEDSERPKARSRFGESASTVSSAVLNHYTGYHRRPINRNSNLLSATLCLVKELDYPSLEVVEHAVRCRIDELAAE